MESARSYLSGPAGIFVRVIFILLAFYILYVIYQWLYTSSDHNDFNLFSEVIVGRPDTTIDTAVRVYPSVDYKNPIFNLADGSSFSISFWIYIEDTKYRPTQNQCILTLGGEPTSADSWFMVYLGAQQYSLKIRTNAAQSTDESTTCNNNSTSGAPVPSSDWVIKKDCVKDIFKSNPIGSLSSNQPNMCDINQIDLQKWNLVTITYNSKTLDVYMDGKLARSCILDSIIKPNKPTKDYKLYVAPFGGFGGYMSNLVLNDYPLNPEQAWRMYMAGPGPKYSFSQYLTSLFDPKSIGSLTYPKYPGTS